MMFVCQDFRPRTVDCDYEAVLLAGEPVSLIPLLDANTWPLSHRVIVPTPSVLDIQMTRLPNSYSMRQLGDR